MSLAASIGAWLTSHPDTVINALVAAGTLSLAGITVYQMRAGVAREMADFVYGPLLPWIVLLTKHQHATRSEFLVEWSQIKNGHPYLSHRVPKRLFAAFEEIRRLQVILNGGLYGHTLNLERAALNEAASEIATLRGSARAGAGDLWIAGEVLSHSRLDLLALWLGNVSVRDFASSEAKRVHDPHWHVETMVDGIVVSKDLADAEKVAAAVFQALDRDPVATDLKNIAREVLRLSSRIAPIVEKKVQTKFASRGRTERAAPLR